MCISACLRMRRTQQWFGPVQRVACSTDSPTRASCAASDAPHSTTDARRASCSVRKDHAFPAELHLRQSRTASPAATRTRLSTLPTPTSSPRPARSRQERWRPFVITYRARARPRRTSTPAHDERRRPIASAHTPAPRHPFRGFYTSTPPVRRGSGRCASLPRHVFVADRWSRASTVRPERRATTTTSFTATFVAPLVHLERRRLALFDRRHDTADALLGPSAWIAGREPTRPSLTPSPRTPDLKAWSSAFGASSRPPPNDRDVGARRPASQHAAR